MTVGEAALASFAIAFGAENSSATPASFKYNVFTYVTPSDPAIFSSDSDDMLSSSMAEARIMLERPVCFEVTVRTRVALVVSTTNAYSPGSNTIFPQ